MVAAESKTIDKKAKKMTQEQLMLLDLSRCQGLLEGIYLGLSYEDFNLTGLKNSLNEAVELLQITRDKLIIKK